ncbi:zinc-ribbon domain-containing protein [Candidatus Bathyarchaeota archaeon]|nr:zinc-ribbon domain-containing protein [Candidatus Bathyarchaeota archaeon]
MQNQQVTNPPSAAYYLTLIGGILGIILGIFLIVVLVGIWLIVANVLMIMYAQKLMAEPKEHSKYGTYILILSILGGINLLCLIGGILAMTYQPMPPFQPTQPHQHQTPAQPTEYGPATTKYCPQCGNPVGGEAQYCPKCGTKLPQ